jgi:hypothetical protein
MMHMQGHGRPSSIAWLILLAALAVCYATIAAGLLGLVGAPSGSLVIVSAAMLGCVAAFVYLATALREIHSHSR